MNEVLPGIFQIPLYKTVSDSETGAGQVYTYIIRDIERRSLMIDAGYNTEACIGDIHEALSILQIDPHRLDVIITHRHGDHCGGAAALSKLGAVIYMNPEEERHKYDCISIHFTDGMSQAQKSVLNSVGVREDITPELWMKFQAFNDYIKNTTDFLLKIPDFTFQPIAPGDVFRVADYSFEIISLKGHTYGQIGLVERGKRLLFPADQLIQGISPIVTTSMKDEHLLFSYLSSIKNLEDSFMGWKILPMHGSEITDIHKTVEKIENAYELKILSCLQRIRASQDEESILEIMKAIYSGSIEQKEMTDFVQLKMMLTKTFSLAEYLYDRKMVSRTERNGTLYYYRDLE